MLSSKKNLSLTNTFGMRRVLHLEGLDIDIPRSGEWAQGKMLMMTLASIALKCNRARFTWQALDWNTPAIDFSTTNIGAEVLT